MNENVNIGICQSRLQLNQPSFFVSWIKNKQQNYEFFSLRFMAESLKTKLENENTKRS